MSSDITINFFISDDADSVNIYRATPTIDINNLPAPITNILTPVNSYTDTGLLYDTEYQYVIGAVYGTEELFSDVISANSSEPIFGTNVVYQTKINQDGKVFNFEIVDGATSGTIYANDIDNNGNVYTVDNINVIKTDSSNTVVWTYAYNSVDTSYSDCIIKGQDGFVYVALRDKRVLKLNDTDGTLVWDYTQHTGIVNKIAVSFDGNVYTASDDNTVHKILPDGNNDWIFNLFQGSVSDIVIDENENIYATGADNTIRKISPAGIEQWYTNGSYLYYNNRLFYREDSSTLYCITNNDIVSIDKTTGTLTKLFDLNYYNNTLGIKAFHVYENGNIFISSSYSNDNHNTLFDPQGNILWSNNHNGYFWSVASKPGLQAIQLGLYSQQ